MNIEEPWGTPTFNGQVGKCEPAKRRRGEKLQHCGHKLTMQLTVRWWTNLNKQTTKLLQSNSETKMCHSFRSTGLKIRSQEGT